MGATPLSIQGAASAAAKRYNLKRRCDGFAFTFLSPLSGIRWATSRSHSNVRITPPLLHHIKIFAFWSPIINYYYKSVFFKISSTELFVVFHSTLNLFIWPNPTQFRRYSRSFQRVKFMLCCFISLFVSLDFRCNFRWDCPVSHTCAYIPLTINVASVSQSLY